MNNFPRTIEELKYKKLPSSDFTFYNSSLHLGVYPGYLDELDYSERLSSTIAILLKNCNVLGWVDGKDLQVRPIENGVALMFEMGNFEKCWMHFFADVDDGVKELLRSKI